MSKIGVFICWCGSNIANTVKIKELADLVSRQPDVVSILDYKYMCSEPGQNLIRETIKEKGLDGVVVSSCSPSLHETTFRSTCESAGLNPYRCEIANIREQCSWVHSDREKATKKARDIVATMIEKVKLNKLLVPVKVPVTKKALVIGGGISGIEASLNIADAGYEVVLVEREPSIGGHMAELSDTFLTLDCSPCLLSSKQVEAYQHPRIKLLTYSEIENFEGYVGNFKVQINRKAPYVNWSKCDGCRICIERCPVSILNGSKRPLGKNRAIYVPYYQAVPNKAVIDRSMCKHFQDQCDMCERVCPKGAIEFDQSDLSVEEEIGAVVVATGFGLYPKEQVGEYGYGKYEDVIDGLEFEQMLSIWGREGREIRRPSDGRIPKAIVFIQCVGSRDVENGVPYCSKVCCMYTAKQAMLYKQAILDGKAYIFYIDVRSMGKGCEEFVQRGIEDNKLLYLRGKVSRVFKESDKIVVWGVDTLSGKKVKVVCDLVVLATAMTSSRGAKELAKTLKISTDKYGFFSEMHPKLRPLETATSGIYLAGCAQAPKDISESIAQAAGAASKVMAMFSADELSHEPIVVFVDKDICIGCGICVEACPYGAREVDEKKKVANVIELLCQGCGACVAACPNGASQQKNFTTAQVLNMTDVILEQVL